MQASPTTYPPGTVRMRPMLDALARNWGLMLLRGVLAILFGVLAILWPGITLLTLVLLYAGFALADGVFSLIAAVRGGTPAPRWWLALVGVMGIGVGIITIFYPQITMLVLLMFIAAWAVVTGALQIYGAIKLRHEIEGEWWLVASGVLSVLFGVMLVAWPMAGGLAIAFVIGTFAIIYGALMIGFALRLRKHAEVRI